MRRDLRLPAYVGVGVLAGLMLALLVMALLTRTDWGLERARRFAVQWLEERVQGELRIGRITGPGLLRGVMVHDVEIVDPRGRLFLRIDSARVAYDWRTLVRRRIVLDRTTLYGPVVNLERLPGDELWNFEYVFPPPEVIPEVDERSLILFQQSRIVNGTVAIRMPWEPDGPVEPADTARLNLERVPGGIVNTWRFTDVNAQLGRVLWESPLEEGQLFEVRSLAMRGFIWEDPVLVRDARGVVTRRDSLLTFDLQRLVLPGSQATLLGSVIFEEGRNLYDVRVDSRRFLWRDLQWIYPPLPDHGGGSMVLHIQSQQPRGVLWHVSDARLAAPGTRLAGTFGIVAGDTLFFTDVDLRASPLNLDLLQAMLPGELPVDGLLIGTVEVRGPLSALDTEGDVRLATRAGGDGGSLRWRGTLDVAGGAAGTQRVRANLRGIDLGLFAGLRPDVPLAGRVSGELDVVGRVTRDVRFTADLTHELAGRPQSRIVGGGSARGWGGTTQLDVLFSAQPLSIEEYLADYPLIRELGAEIQGPIRLYGRPDSLNFEGELGSRAGSVRLAGFIGGGAGPPRYAGLGTFSGFRGDVVAPALPETRVSGSFAFDLVRGVDGALSGPLRAQVDSASVGALPQIHGDVRAGLAEGRLVVDSLRFESALGTVTGAGALGIDEDTDGTLAIELASDDLGALESVLFAEPQPVSNETARIAGRLRASATLTGSVSAFDLDAHALLRGLVYEESAAQSIELRLSAHDVGSGRAHGELAVAADTLTLLGHELERAGFGASYENALLRFVSRAGANGRDLFAAAGAVERRSADAALAGNGAHDVSPESGVGLTLVTLDELRIGDDAAAWTLRQPASIRLFDNTAYVDALEFGRLRGSGLFSASGRLAWRVDEATAHDSFEPVDFDVAFTGVPLDDFLQLTRSTADASADVDGRLRVTGTARAPVLDAEVTLHRPRIADAMFGNASARIRYAERSMYAALHAYVGQRRVLAGEGTIPIDLSFTGVEKRRLAEPLDFVITAERLPAATVLGLLDGFSSVSGSLDGTLALRGTTAEPTFEGGILVSNGGALWDATGVRYRDVSGTVSTVRNRVLGIDLTGRAIDTRVRSVTGIGRGGAGTGRVTGTLDFAVPADPAFELSVRADEVLAARRRDADVTVTGDATLRGRFNEPVVGGALRVDRGVLYLDEIYRQYLVVDLEDALFFDAIDTTQFAIPDVPTSAFLRHLIVDNVQIGVGQGSWLRSRDMNVEVTGNVTVSLNRAREEMRLIGSMQVLRGTYQLYYPPFVTRRFEVQQGTIEFPGTPGLDPTLAISAVYRAKSIHGDALDITADVYGTLDAPRVRLSSNAQPPISESDLASYLFFGAPTSALAQNAPGGGAFDFGDFGRRTFGPSALGYVASGLQSLAQSTGFIDYIGLSTAESLPGAQSGFGSVFSDAQLEIGLYLAPEMFVAFTKRLNSAGADAGVRLEWRFHPTFTAELFAEDRFARTPSLGFTQAPGEARKIYGLWLFREWGY